MPAPALDNGTSPRSPTRRSVKKATRFSVMVAGQAGLGKTTLLATLFSPNLQPDSISTAAGQPQIFSPTKKITIAQFELEPESGVPLIIEAIDTPGYDDEISPESQADTLLSYLETAFDEIFEEEKRIHRNPKFEEHRVHVLLYLLEPTSIGLKQFDCLFMKKVMNRVNIIPIIAKADAYEPEERLIYKKRIMQDIRDHGIEIFELPTDIFQSIDDLQVAPSWASLLPFTVAGASFPTQPGAPRGRQYPWGFFDVDDPKSCDLGLLQRTLLIYARDELREVTEDRLYETYRTEKLLQGPDSKVPTRQATDAILTN